MTEVVCLKESERSIKESSLYQCYMVLLEDLLFPHKKYRSDSTPPTIFKKLENTFASPEKFEELKESFNKIFSRIEGENVISPKEKWILMRWYGLIDGKPYYEGGGIVEGTEKIAEELDLTKEGVNEMKSTGFLKLKESWNFNLLPEEAKKIARF